MAMMEPTEYQDVAAQAITESLLYRVSLLEPGIPDCRFASLGVQRETLPDVRISVKERYYDNDTIIYANKHYFQ
jgi:hypothetical protein